MSLDHAYRDILRPFPAWKIALVAVLGLALLGGLFHHHELASDSDGCSYCHAGIQTPVIDLTDALVTPAFTVVGAVAEQLPFHHVRNLHFSLLVPRAPPLSTLCTVFGEGCVGLV
jgi:hypothetical protein